MPIRARVVSVRPLVALLLAGALAVPGAVRAQRTPVAPRACRVDRVVDGDTFYCRDGLRVRLLGIDAPERSQGAAYGRARGALAALLPRGAEVRREGDAAEGAAPGEDRYGRRLAWVWRGETLVNEQLVREGWAVRYTGGPVRRFQPRLRAAERAAREARAGLWRSGDFACLPIERRRGDC